jgi:hypothetical protein
VYEYGVTNIEYTEFERLGISDEAVSASSKTSVFPANTNVLFVGLGAARRVVQEVRPRHARPAADGCSPVPRHAPVSSVPSAPLVGNVGRLSHPSGVGCAAPRVPMGPDRAPRAPGRGPPSQAVSSGDGAQLLPGLIFNLNKKVSYTDPIRGDTKQVCLCLEQLA